MAVQKPSTLLYVCLILAIAFSACLSPQYTAQATSGDLINGFGTSGIVTTDPSSLSDSIAKVEYLDDGKILAAGYSLNKSTYAEGDFILARYSSDGSLDTTFGVDGLATASFGDGWSDLMDMAVLPDGRIVAVGMFHTSGGASRQFAVARFCPDGKLDTGTNCSDLTPKFSDDGMVLTQVDAFMSQSYANAVAIQSDGKIVAGGQSRGSGGNSVLALVRYLDDGSLDTGFGTNGFVITDVGGFQDELADLAIDSSGRILAGGFTNDTALGTTKFVLARYNPDGSLDTAFNETGIVTTLVGESSVGKALAIQPGDGKIILAGSAYSDMTSYYGGFAAARYNTDGSLDTSFAGGTGWTIFYFYPALMYDFLSSMTLDDVGRIVMSGTTYPDESFADETTQAAVARLCPDGSLDSGGVCSDSGFGGDGLLSLSIGFAGADFKSVAINPTDGSVLAGGWSVSDTQNVFTLALFEGDPPAQTINISGNAGAAGVTLSYMDGTAKSITSDSSGAYWISVPENWTGTVTPAKAGFTFTPTSRSYTTVAADLTDQDYTAAMVRFTISGNAGSSGVILHYLDGSAKTATAGADGQYSFSVPYNWIGDVTPEKAGFTFTPEKRSYNGLLQNQANQDFSAAGQTYTISGNAGVAGAVVTYTDGQQKTVTAGADGGYSLEVSYNWSGTLTPSKPGYAFTPSSRAYTEVLANQTGADFTVGLLAPVVQPPAQVFWNGFTAAWNANPAADRYLLDVATDAGFTQFLEGYEGRDVSAVTSFTVSGLPAHSTYYYRVRAEAGALISGYSATMAAQPAYSIFLPAILNPGVR
jgi:uncharacterized delta-60 repeat protein